MTDTDSDKYRRNAWRGMDRARAHAVEMVRSGRLDAKELDEFQRYLVGQALENLSMEEYARARKNGLAEEWQFKSGLDFDDERHPLDAQKARDAIAKKIAGDFVGQAWEAGAIDDKTYMAQMERTGGVPERLLKAREARESDKPDFGKEAAIETWRHNNGDEDSGITADEATSEADSMAVSADDVKEFKAVTPTNALVAVLREKPRSARRASIAAEVAAAVAAHGWEVEP